MSAGEWISPGPVGSIGCFAVTPRLRQSCSELPNRYDPAFSGTAALLNGNNVSDGSHASFVSGGGPAKLVAKAFDGDRGFNHVNGQYWQDLRPENRLVIPLQGGTGSMSWELKKQAVMSRPRNFILPNGYEPEPGAVPRGGNEPSIQGYLGGSDPVAELAGRFGINTMPQGSSLLDLLSGKPTNQFGRG